MRGGIQQFIYRNARADSSIWTLIVHTTILTSSYFLIDEVRCKSFTLPVISFCLRLSSSLRVAGVARSIGRGALQCSALSVEVKCWQRKG